MAGGMERKLLGHVLYGCVQSDSSILLTDSTIQLLPYSAMTYLHPPHSVMLSPSLGEN